MKNQTLIAPSFLFKLGVAGLLAMTMQQAVANEVEFIDIDKAKAVYVVTQDNLELQAKPLKDDYTVNEAIQFVVKTNQSAYAYIFANDKYGQTRQIYPNQNDTNNLLTANRNNIVPSLNSSAEIIADRAGVETFTIITTKSPLNMADLFKVAQGQYQSAPTDEVEVFLKSIGVETANNSQSDTIAVEKLQVSINSNNVVIDTASKGQNQHSASKLTNYGNTLLLSTNKANYMTNERVNVTYAGTGKNYLSLGVRYTNGQIKPLKTIKNDTKVHQVQFMASPSISELVLWESNKRNPSQYPDANASVLLNLNIQ